jgi:hypothetical protein
VRGPVDHERQLARGIVRCRHEGQHATLGN